MGVSVTTAEYYPVVVGDALTENFGRNFNWIVLVHRNIMEAPVCRFKTSDEFPIMFRTPNIPDLKAEVCVEDAGSYIIDQHNLLFKKGN